VSSTSNQRYHLRKVHEITDPEQHADNQQTTLDTHILRPFRVDVARKLLDRRNRLWTGSVECIEWLHHWLGSGIVADVLTSMNIDGLIVIND